MSQQARGLGQHLSDEELSSIVATAHSLGLKVAAHAHGAQGVTASVRAGVNSIEHGTYLDAETAKMMAARGTWLVPTLGLLNSHGTADTARITPAVQAKMAEARKVSGDNIRLAVRYNVNIAFGTDAGVSPHGENARQFRKMVEQGPMTPMAALRSATVDAAALLGQSENIGTIAPGEFPAHGCGRGRSLSRHHRAGEGRRRHQGRSDHRPARRLTHNKRNKQPKNWQKRNL